MDEFFNPKLRRRRLSCFAVSQCGRGLSSEVRTRRLRPPQNSGLPKGLWILSRDMFRSRTCLAVLESLYAIRAPSTVIGRLATFENSVLRKACSIQQSDQ